MILLNQFERFSAVPAGTGLYDPSHEKDSCGFAMVATMRGSAGHDIIAIALSSLRNLEHRGAVGSDAGRGASLIVWAIAEGRGAAARADEYLRGRTTLPIPVSAHDAPIHF